ncbi:hypothetical protein PGT21_009321 [Puccinia graminis f. sp. tritici]|uniref:Uncharacterized protein n=1 Tax=Puccinia graminis f. sp. tritici TaxID=56615 RepID=A0A5B0PNF9_PUCGR|nr:hypothetical protein PGT21_009321 [Puccinia graminis f. sp. tritici]
MCLSAYSFGRNQAIHPQMPKKPHHSSSSPAQVSASLASPSFRGSLREVPPARRGPPVPLERGDCAKLARSQVCWEPGIAPDPPYAT